MLSQPYSYTGVVRDDCKLPSQTTDVYWIFIVKHDESSQSTIGKWLVFEPFDKIDDTWSEIREAVVKNELGGCLQAKTSTIRYSPTSSGPGPSTTAAICVFAKECNMDAIGFKLIELIKRDIRFKPDVLTFSGTYAHSSAGPTTTKTLYWNDGKPSFVKEGKSRAVYRSVKNDIWQINVVKSPEPFCSEKIYGRWIVGFEDSELTVQWHQLRELIEDRAENIGVIKMECPKKRFKISGVAKPVFLFFISKERKTSAGNRLIRLVGRDIIYQQEREPGSPSLQETLYWNNGMPDYVNTNRNGN